MNKDVLTRWDVVNKTADWEVMDSHVREPSCLYVQMKAAYIAHRKELLLESQVVTNMLGSINKNLVDCLGPLSHVPMYLNFYRL